MRHIFTIFFIFLGLFLYIKFAGPIPFTINSVTTTKDSFFTVDGKAEVTAIPDTAQISLGVTQKATTVQQAQTQVNTIINKITTDIKNLGVGDKDIKTTNYSVNPEYDYSTAKQTLTDYSVNANLQINVKPIDKANQAVDLATRDGANQVGGIQFTVNDTEQKQLENQARNQAIQDAKDKAKSISQAAGLRLGRIVDVKESPQYNPRPIPYLAAEKTSDTTTPPTQLNPGENQITSTVTLSYETY